LIFLAFASSAFGGRSPNGGEVLGFLFVIILVGYGWYQLFLHSPFSISVK
jgi:lipopolysaccharide export LptBFGC system permease protein LptF